MTTSTPYQLLHDRLNAETARLNWHTLLVHFAAGNVVAVDPALDLLDVAIRMSLDDTAAVQSWMAAGLLGKVSDAQAAQWLADDPALWTVIVKPWIVVQSAAPALTAPTAVQ
jgi:hypothetical protein